MKKSLPWLLLALIVTLSACGKGSETSGEESASASQNQPAGNVPAVGVTAPGDDAVVATVNGQDITGRDLRRVFENLDRQKVQPDSTFTTGTPQDRLRRTALKLLIDQQVVLQEAAKAGLTAPDDEVQARLSQIKTNSGGDAAFQQLLAGVGANEQDVLRDISSSMTLQSYFTKNVPPTPEVSEAEIRAYYDNHPEYFGPQPEVSAQHILLRTSPDMDDMAKGELLTTAQVIISRLDKGEDFGDLAREYSQDETNSQTGGQLGWFRPGQMVAPFDSAAFALEVGSVGGPVETQFGYHIIKVIDRRSSEGRKYDEVKATIQGLLAQEKTNAATQAIVDDLRSKAKVTIAKEWQ